MHNILLFFNNKKFVLFAVILKMQPDISNRQRQDPLECIAFSLLTLLYCMMIYINRVGLWTWIKHTRAHTLLTFCLHCIYGHTMFFFYLLVQLPFLLLNFLKWKLLSECGMLTAISVLKDMHAYIVQWKKGKREKTMFSEKRNRIIHVWSAI